MEGSKRRVGRPKASPQTGPLVLSERRTRTKVEIEIGAETADELAEYVRWVETSQGMATADARAATVEFALRDVFKRDRLWREWRRKGEVVERLATTRRSAGADTRFPLPTALGSADAAATVPSCNR